MARDPQQPLAQGVRAVPTLGGAAGFFTGGTLSIFGINALHNAVHLVSVVHLVSGVLGLAAGFYAGGRWARYYNQRFGVIYLLVTALGFVAPALTASQLAINSANNVLPRARHRAGRRRIRCPIQRDGVGALRAGSRLTAPQSLRASESAASEPALPAPSPTFPASLNQRGLRLRVAGRVAGRHVHDERGPLGEARPVGALHRFPKRWSKQRAW